MDSYKITPMANKYSSAGVGTRIKSARKDLGMTQTTLGKAAGVTKGAVSAWEKGDTKNLKLENLFAIADELNVNARWLAVHQGMKTKLTISQRQDFPDEVEQLALKIAALPPEKRDLLVHIFESHASPESVAARINPAPTAKKR